MVKKTTKKTTKKEEPVKKEVKQQEKKGKKVIKKEEEAKMEIEGTKEELYLYFDSSFVVKTTFEELSSFIASIVNKDGSQLEQDFLSNFINDLDVTFIIDILQEILNAIETGDDKITVNLDLIKYDLGTFMTLFW